MMQFMKEITEARLIRSDGDLKKTTYADLCENLYFTVLTLEFLNRFKKTRSLAVNYAKQTAAYNNYSEFRLAGTDLYNMIHLVDSSPENIEEKFSKDAATLRKQIHLPTMGLNRWLLSIDGTSSREANFLMRLEQSLKVYNTDYKDIRRYLDSKTISNADIAKIKTKILYYFRQKMNMSDLLPSLESMLNQPLD